MPCSSHDPQPAWLLHNCSMPANKRRTRRLLVLSVALVLAVAQPAAALADIVLDLGSGVYNPSLVVYQGSAWVVARSTQLKWDTTVLKWILNRAHLCELNTTDWSTISCHSFDPYRGRYGVQCRWGSDEWKVPWEAWGVDDTKLFTWPGRGLWAVTGRRPQRAGDKKYCPQVIWRQWLVQLAAEGAAPDPHAFDHPADDTIPDVTWDPQGQQQQQPAPGATAAAAAAADTEDSSSLPRQLLSRWRRLLWQRRTGGSIAMDGLPHIPENLAQRKLLQPGVADDSYSLGDAAAEQQQRQQQQQQQQQQRSRPRRRRRRRVRRHRRPARPGAAGAAALSTASGHSSRPPLPLLPSGSSASAPLPSNSSSSSSGDAWAAFLGGQPVPLHIQDAVAVYGKGYAITEKNWMPFVHEGQLYVTYSLAPKHRVYRLHPDGAAEPKHETDTGAVFAPLGAAASKVHGGPPMVRIDYAALTTQGLPANSSSGSPQLFYLGVAHYWEPAGGGDKDSRRYRHYLIKVQPQPPFAVLQVSRELPLQYNTHYKQVAFVSGLDLALLPAGAADPSHSTGPAATPTSAAAGTAGRGLRPSVSRHTLQLPAADTPLHLRQLRETEALTDSTSSRRLQAASADASAAAAATAGTDSTGSLLADAKADEFSWDVRPRPADVNTFTWVANPGDTSSGKPQPAKPAAVGAAAGVLGPAPAGSAATLASSSSSAAPTSASSSPAAATSSIPDEALLPGSVAVTTAAGLAAATSSSKRRDQEPEQLALLPADPQPWEGTAGGLLADVSAAATGAADSATAAGTASGVAGAQGGLVPHIIISYGSGDWESRLAVLTLQEMEQLFEG